MYYIVYDNDCTSNKYVLWSFTSFSAPVQKKKKYFDTETDPEKLCNNLCGGNIYVEGEDPKLGPDSDYPKWLWELRTEGKLFVWRTGARYMGVLETSEKECSKA